jgi:uncharacterized repeat protein (TIGR01451 family)
MLMRCARAHGGASGALAVGVTLTTLLLVLTAPPRAAAGTRFFDIDLDDRVDPVRPGEDVVYEIEIENNRTTAAPDVVVTDFMPPGTSYVAAYRAPDYTEIPAQVFSDRVEWHLGAIERCGQLGLPPCRTIWAAFRVGNGVAPGTVMENVVTMESSDPFNFPAHQDQTYTSVGSAAIRKARVILPVLPDRDRVSVEADLARNGRHTPSDPPPPTIDPADGVRVVIAEPGGATALDITVPVTAFRCLGRASLRCRLATPRDWRPLGLDRLNIFLPLVHLQRNNAQVIVRTSKITLPDDFGPVVRLTIESGGVTYTDDATLIAKGARLAYRHKQTQP